MSGKIRQLQCGERIVHRCSAFLVSVSVQEPPDGRDADKLYRAENDALDHPRRKKRTVGRAVEQRDPQRVEKEAQDKLVDCDGGHGPGPAPAAVQKEAEDQAGQEGRQREAGEVGPNGEQKGSDEVGERPDRPGGQRTEEHGGDDDRDEAEADLDVPHAEGQKPRKYDLQRGEERKGGEGAGCEKGFGHTICSLPAVNEAFRRTR